MMGKDDRAVVTGAVDVSITVRIIGGTGDDELVDSSEVCSALLGFLPLRTRHTATYFYDDAGKNVFIEGPSTSIDSSSFRRPPGGKDQY